MNIQKEIDKVNEEQRKLIEQHQAVQNSLQGIVIKIQENNGILKFLQEQLEKEIKIKE